MVLMFLCRHEEVIVEGCEQDDIEGDGEGDLAELVGVELI